MAKNNGQDWREPFDRMEASINSNFNRALLVAAELSLHSIRALAA